MEFEPVFHANAGAAADALQMFGPEHAAFVQQLPPCAVKPRAAVFTGGGLLALCLVLREQLFAAFNGLGQLAFEPGHLHGALLELRLLLGAGLHQLVALRLQRIEVLLQLAVARRSAAGARGFSAGARLGRFHFAGQPVAFLLDAVDLFLQADHLLVGFLHLQLGLAQGPALLTVLLAVLLGQGAHGQGQAQAGQQQGTDRGRFHQNSSVLQGPGSRAG